MSKSNPTPEQFTPEQIDFLRHCGVRVVPSGASQAVFNDRADKVEGRLRRLRSRLTAALDEEPVQAPTAPAGHTPLCMAPVFVGDVVRIKPQ